MEVAEFPGQEVHFLALLGLSARSLGKDVHRFLASTAAPVSPLGLATNRLSLPTKGTGVRWEVAVREEDAARVLRLSGSIYATHRISVVESNARRFRSANAACPFPVGTPGVILRFLPLTTTESDVRVFLEQFSFSRSFSRPIRIITPHQHPFSPSTPAQPQSHLLSSLPPEATVFAALDSDAEAMRACAQLQSRFFEGVASLSPGRTAGTARPAPRRKHTFRATTGGKHGTQKLDFWAAPGAGLAEKTDMLKHLLPLQRWVQVELMP